MMGDILQVKEEVEILEGPRLLTKKKLIFSSFSIIFLLVFSGFLANTVKNNAARQSNATLAQNRLSTMILTIKADVAQSMLPAHDYLIMPSPLEKEEFLEMSKQIDMDFNILQINQHFEPIDHKIIDNAYEVFKKLERIQLEIFALRGEEIDANGPRKMEKMHVYQDAILDNLSALNNLEIAELESLIMNEQDTNRRSVILIAAAAMLALMGALLVGYLGSKT